MKKQSLAAQNAVTQPIVLVKEPTSTVVAIATSAATVATAVVAVQVELIEGEWITVGVFDAVAQAKVASLTGASQYGWTDVPTAQRARAIRTDATGGTCEVGIEQIRA